MPTERHLARLLVLTGFLLLVIASGPSAAAPKMPQAPGALTPLGHWLFGYLTLPVLVAAVTVIWGAYKWKCDRSAARQRHDEERFQAISDRLDSEQPATRLNAAINVRTFLSSGHEAFYARVFTLVTTQLRLRADPSPLQAGRPLALPATELNQALVLAFRQAYPLARDLRSQRRWNVVRKGKRRIVPAYLPAVPWFASSRDAALSTREALDASELHFSNVNLTGADLREIWMPRSSMTSMGLSGADLGLANLQNTSFVRCNLAGAKLDGTDLAGAGFGKCDLRGVNFRNADLTNTRFSACRLEGADLTGANVDAIKAFERVRMAGVIGLTEQQQQVCALKGATFDDEPA